MNLSLHTSTYRADSDSESALERNDDMYMQLKLSFLNDVKFDM